MHLKARKPIPLYRQRQILQAHHGLESDLLAREQESHVRKGPRVLSMPLARVRSDSRQIQRKSIIRGPQKPKARGVDRSGKTVSPQDTQITGAGVTLLHGITPLLLQH